MSVINCLQEEGKKEKFKTSKEKSRKIKELICGSDEGPGQEEEAFRQPAQFQQFI